MVQKMILSLLFLSAVMASPVLGDALLAPGDPIIAIDTDGLVSYSETPGHGGEDPPEVLDADLNSKYLNFGGGRYNTGFIVTLAGGSSTVQSFMLGTGGDAPERDPAEWTLWGTNEAIVSADHSTGLAENWTLIGSGADAGLNADPGRKAYGSVVNLANSSAYTSYKMTYPTIRGGSGMMQVSEVDLFTGLDGAGSDVMADGDPMLAIQATPDSHYPGGEAPSYVVDGTLGKYLNFGKTNSGFVITPAYGASIVDSFEITTANDSEERDPTSWELYGTNELITSADNSVGDSETWTLIDSGDVTLPETRDTLGPLVQVDSDTVYTSYKMIFPTVKAAENANSMQIAEIQFYGIPEPATLCLLGLGGLSLIRRRRKN